MATLIRATCSDCGDVELGTHDLIGQVVRGHRVGHVRVPLPDAARRPSSVTPTGPRSTCWCRRVAGSSSGPPRPSWWSVAPPARPSRTTTCIDFHEMLDGPTGSASSSPPTESDDLTRRRTRRRLRLVAGRWGLARERPCSRGAASGPYPWWPPRWRRSSSRSRRDPWATQRPALVDDRAPAPPRAGVARQRAGRRRRQRGRRRRVPATTRRPSDGSARRRRRRRRSLRERPIGPDRGRRWSPPAPTALHSGHVQRRRRRAAGDPPGGPDRAGAAAPARRRSPGRPGDGRHPAHLERLPGRAEERVRRGRRRRARRTEPVPLARAVADEDAEAGGATVAAGAATSSGDQATSSRPRRRHRRPGRGRRLPPEAAAAGRGPGRRRADDRPRRVRCAGRDRGVRRDPAPATRRRRRRADGIGGERAAS